MMLTQCYKGNVGDFKVLRAELIHPRKLLLRSCLLGLSSATPIRNKHQLTEEK